MSYAFESYHDGQVPDASREGVRRYWSGLRQEYGAIFELLDSQEDWTIDQQTKITELLNKLVNELQTNQSVVSYLYRNPEKVVRFLAWLKAGTAMMILHCADEDRRRIIELLLTTCMHMMQSHDPQKMAEANVSLERFLVMERYAMLNQLFRSERALAIKEALKELLDLREKIQDQGGVL